MTEEVFVLKIYAGSSHESNQKVVLGGQQFYTLSTYTKLYSPVQLQV